MRRSLCERTKLVNQITGGEQSGYDVPADVAGRSSNKTHVFSRRLGSMVGSSHDFLSDLILQVKVNLKSAIRPGYPNLGRGTSPPDLARDLKTWIARHPQRHNPQAFLFPTTTGTAYRVGNFLKRVLKPIAKSAGIEDFDFRAMRSTASTLFQTHGSVKDTQGQMRHADPTTTLRYYVKVIPENQRKAVADFERAVMKRAGKQRSKANPSPN